MNWHKLLKKERRIWHEHFIPGLLAGILVGLITEFFQLSGSNVALFASIGASAVILTHEYRHHLTMLRTILGSYILAGSLSLALTQISMSHPVRVGLVIMAATMLLYSVNLFHPPAISAALAIVLYDRELTSLIYVLLVTMVAFVLLRFFIYVFRHRLEVKEFMHEFLREESSQ